MTELEKILVPTADAVMTPVLEKLYVLRPKSYQHLNLAGPGIWHHPAIGYRAQAAFVLKRLAERTANNRLATATGQDLKEYVASEYDVIPDTSNTKAIGEATLVRPTGKTSGDVPKGTRLSRAANLTTQVPLLAADYETLVDLHFDRDQLVAGPIPVRSIREGSFANHPITVTANVALDGAIGGASMVPARALVVTSAVATGAFAVGSSVVISGTDATNAPISETFLVSLANGGEAISGVALFKTVTNVVIDPQANSSGVFQVGVQSDGVNNSAIKTAIASSASPSLYTLSALNGTIGTGVMNPVRRLTAALTASVGSYLSTSTITFTGLDSNSLPLSESILVTMPNGGGTLTTTGSFSAVTSIAVEAQINASGSFSFGVAFDGADTTAIESTAGGVDGGSGEIPHGVSVQELFDKFITVGTFSAAGGSDSVDDPYVKTFARAFAQGQYGPTEAASRLGVLRATGVRNLLVFDIPGTGTEQVLVGDVSWASSVGWVNAVQQSLYDSDLIGVGCKVVVAGVTNKVVSVVAEVTLRDKNYLADTTEIDNAIRAAVASYLNDRKDWNIWKTNGLQAAITRAHSKVFNCSSAIMKDSTNTTIPEITNPDYTQPQYHYLLANGAVKITYSGPS